MGFRPYLVSFQGADDARGSICSETCQIRYKKLLLRNFTLYPRCTPNTISIRGANGRIKTKDSS